MMYLSHPVLGQLDLDCDPDGYVVSQFEIGFPDVRPVVVPRALADGVLDTTRFVGQRAITVSITLDQTKMATQDLLDMLMPYLSPRYRPRLVYAVQDPVVNPNHVRSFEVRGVDAPLVIDGPKFQTVVCQWVALDHRATSIEERCVQGVAGGDEIGREYDLEFDRDYPPSLPVGVVQFDMVGNDPADWTATIIGPVDDPVLTVNGIDITFTGVSVTGGQGLVIDTRNRTMILGGNLSVYGDSNFVDWVWDDLLLRPGVNQIRLEGTDTDPDTYVLLCFRDTWL